MGKAKNLTISKLMQVIRDEEYNVVFKRWSGKNYEFLGKCDFHKVNIEINYNRIYKLPRTEKRILFVHEFAHAYLDTIFISPGVDNYFSDEDAEVIVEALAQKICNNASPKKLEMLDIFINKHLKKADRYFNAVKVPRGKIKKAARVKSHKAKSKHR